MTQTLIRERLDSEAVAKFRRDGFIAIHDFIDLAEVERLKAILMRLHTTNVGFREGAQFDAAAPDGDIKDRRFPQILNPRIYAPELMNGEYHRAALEFARAILGDKVKLKNDISFMKPPRIGSDTPWHQDEAFGNPAFDCADITIWLALTPANRSNSCMSFVPGSHEFPVLPHQPLGGDPRIHALECIGDFDTSTAVECPLPPGGCTIHTCRTLHYAGPNPSDEYRLAYALVFDTPPTPRTVPQDFPWSKQQLTDRAIRHQNWRRHGGIILHIWRERNRVGSRLLAELRRAYRRLSRRLHF